MCRWVTRTSSTSTSAIRRRGATADVRAPSTSTSTIVSSSESTVVEKPKDEVDPKKKKKRKETKTKRFYLRPRLWPFRPIRRPPSRRRNHRRGRPGWTRPSRWRTPTEFQQKNKQTKQQTKRWNPFFFSPFQPFPECYLCLPSFHGFCWVLLSFSKFYQV